MNNIPPNVTDEELTNWKSRLGRIFIRVKNDDELFEEISLLNTTPEQFDRWFKDYINSRVSYKDDDLLNKASKLSVLDELGISPLEVVHPNDPEAE